MTARLEAIAARKLFSLKVGTVMSLEADPQRIDRTTWEELITLMPDCCSLWLRSMLMQLDRGCLFGAGMDFQRASDSLDNLVQELGRLSLDF